MPLENEQAVDAPAELNIESAVAGIANDLRLVEAADADGAGGEGDGTELPGAGEGEAAGKGTATDASQAASPAPAAATQADPNDVPPDTWTKGAKEKWGTLPPELKQEIRKRESDIAKYVGETKASVGVAQAFEKVVSPYLGIYQERGIDPWKQVSSLLQAHAALTWGTPEQKIQGFTALAQGAGIDLTAFAKGDSVGALNSPAMQRIQQLEDQIRQLQGGVTTVTSEIQAARTAELETAVLAFAQDTEAHPHFWDVQEQIQHFIRTGAASTLQDAYDLAVMANPVTREKVLDARARKLAEQQASAANARAAKARKAVAVNVVSRGKGRAAPPSQSVDDTLRETLQDINSRTH